MHVAMPKLKIESVDTGKRAHNVQVLQGRGTTDRFPTDVLGTVIICQLDTVSVARAPHGYSL